MRVLPLLSTITTASPPRMPMVAVGVRMIASWFFVIRPPMKRMTPLERLNVTSPDCWAGS